MNTEAGQVYRGETEIRAAQQRGEPVVEVSEKVALLMEMGNRYERRRRKFGKARRENLNG